MKKILNKAKIRRTKWRRVKKRHRTKRPIEDQLKILSFRGGRGLKSFGFLQKSIFYRMVRHLQTTSAWIPYDNTHKNVDNLEGSPNPTVGYLFCNYIVSKRTQTIWISLQCPINALMETCDYEGNKKILRRRKLTNSSVMQDLRELLITTKLSLKNKVEQDKNIRFMHGERQEYSFRYQ